MAYKKEERFDAQKAQIEEVAKRVMQKCIDEKLDPWEWYLVGKSNPPQNWYTKKMYRGCNEWACRMLGVSNLISETQFNELKDKYAGFKYKIEDYYERDRKGTVKLDKYNKPIVDWKRLNVDRAKAYKAFKDKGGIIPKRKLYPTLDENGNQVYENGKPVMHYAEKFPIVYFGSDNKKDEDGEILFDEKGNEEKYWFARLYWLIDIREIENYDFGLTTEPEKTDFNDNLKAEEVFKNYFTANNIKVTHDASLEASYFSKLGDRIGMSKKTLYKGEGKYYQVLAHEAGHSTGTEKRLGRVGIVKGGTMFGKGQDIYAEEELVAEFCSIFCQQELGLHGEFNNDCAYIKSWWEHLKNDPKKFARACNAGYKAYEYIFSFSKAKENVA